GKHRGRFSGEQLQVQTRCRESPVHIPDRGDLSMSEAGELHRERKAEASVLWHARPLTPHERRASTQQRPNSPGHPSGGIGSGNSVSVAGVQLKCSSRWRPPSRLSAAPKVSLRLPWSRSASAWALPRPSLASSICCSSAVFLIHAPSNWSRSDSAVPSTQSSF